MYELYYDSSTQYQVSCTRVYSRDGWHIPRHADVVSTGTHSTREIEVVSLKSRLLIGLVIALPLMRRRIISVLGLSIMRWLQFICLIFPSTTVDTIAAEGKAPVNSLSRTLLRERRWVSQFILLLRWDPTFYVPPYARKV